MDSSAASHHAPGSSDDAATTAPAWALDDARRLDVLAALGVEPGAIDAVFDPYTRLVARLLGVPVALVSFVTADRQVFLSSVGLAEPWATRGETPLELSFCQHVVTGDDALVVTDAAHDPRVSANPAIVHLGVSAYLGTPLRGPGGEPLGSLCAIDTAPRTWSDADPAALREVADAAEAAVALRVNEHRREVDARRASHRLRTPITAARLELEDMVLDPDTPDEVREGLGTAVGHIDALADTVTDLLARANASGDRPPPRP